MEIKPQCDVSPQYYKTLIIIISGHSSYDTQNVLVFLLHVIFLSCQQLGPPPPMVEDEFYIICT